jgi:positive regulator of sigma E activity
MLEQGTVTHVGSGRADVFISPSEKCEECGACSEGANGIRLMEGALDPIGVHVGDVVEIETPPRARRRAQMLVFVAPVVALGVGYLAGYLLGPMLGIAGDTLGAAFGLAAAAGMFLSLRGARATGVGEKDGMPRVRAIIARGHEADSGT